ncbi:hypothetical protein [Bosea sp. (in: a-proteobacteria)]|uniref:hypothetical protein n=1 Tax=Bosea sp. (in: a-proteobacteria) TaxID=1871050 RepID=UPI003F6F38AB
MYRFPPVKVLMSEVLDSAGIMVGAEFLYTIISLCPFDENWYINQYPDVAALIQKGDLFSGKDHYCRTGYWEGRIPFEIVVDEPWYCVACPDVARAIKDGLVTSASAHYHGNGYFEGRQPSLVPIDENWYLSAYPVVKARLQNGISESVVDDFFRYGYRQGLLPFRPSGR